jgi:Leucine-rich repeat (LRR) protein
MSAEMTTMKLSKYRTCILLSSFLLLGIGVAQEPPRILDEAAFEKWWNAESIKGLALGVKTNGVSVVPSEEDLRDLSWLKKLPVVRFYAPDSVIESLAGFEALTHLQVLNVSKNNIRDLSPLKNLPLISLNIANNPVQDLSPILSPTLKELYLHGTEVKDLACLTNTSLERLELGYLSVTQAFQTLMNVPLKRLSFAQSPQMQLRDIASLRLESLTMIDLPQDELGCLTNMPLKELTLCSSQIDSLAPLAGMGARSLTIESNSLRLLHGIEALPLERLELHTPGVWDVWPIRNMAIKELYLFCGDGDLTSITNLPLRVLGVDKEVAVRNINLLKKMKTLELIGFDTWRGHLGRAYPVKAFFDEYESKKEPVAVEGKQ